jgi:hypothetical protein
MTFTDIKSEEFSAESKMEVELEEKCVFLHICIRLRGKCMQE